MFDVLVKTNKNIKIYLFLNLIISQTTLKFMFLIVSIEFDCEIEIYCIKKMRDLILAFLIVLFFEEIT